MTQYRFSFTYAHLSTRLPTLDPSGVDLTGETELSLNWVSDTERALKVCSRRMHEI